MVEVIQCGPNLQLNEVTFRVKENSPPGDAALFRAAADWLEKNDNFTLISVSFQGYFGLKREKAELKIYVED